MTLIIDMRLVVVPFTTDVRLKDALKTTRRIIISLFSSFQM